MASQPMTGALVLKSTGFAGLGDLLLALDRALSVAKATGRAIVIDWRDTPYGRGEDNLFDQLFRLQGTDLLPLSTLKHAVGTVYPPAWSTCLDQPMRVVYASQTSENWNRRLATSLLDAGADALTSSADWVVLWDHVQHELADRPPESFAQPDFRPLALELRTKSSIQTAIDTFAKQHFSSAMVGVHARGSREAVAAGKSASFSQLIHCIDGLLHDQSNPGLFLASDNERLIAAICSRYPSAKVRPKWLPEPGASLHLTPSDDLPRFQIAIDAVVDLWLLAACTWIVHPAGSSFSIAARRLSGLPPCRIRPIPPVHTGPSLSARWLSRLPRCCHTAMRRLRQLSRIR